MARRPSCHWPGFSGDLLHGAEHEDARQGLLVDFLGRHGVRAGLLPGDLGAAVGQFLLELLGLQTLALFGQVDEFARRNRRRICRRRNKWVRRPAVCRPAAAQQAAATSTVAAEGGSWLTRFPSQWVQQAGRGAPPATATRSQKLPGPARGWPLRPAACRPESSREATRRRASRSVGGSSGSLGSWLRAIMAASLICGSAWNHTLPASPWPPRSRRNRFARGGRGWGFVPGPRRPARRGGCRAGRGD